MKDADRIHKVVHFSGRVQGVGFRYSTCLAAKEFEVTGSVRNLADGRVRLDAVGRPAEVNAFIAEISDRMGDFIRDTEEREERPASTFRSFSIA